jgi:hypothetical protein
MSYPASVTQRKNTVQTNHLVFVFLNYAFETGIDSAGSAKKIQSGSQQCSDSNSGLFSVFSFLPETDLTTGTASLGYHKITRQMRFKDNTKKE